jgi:hypothetical protein
VTITPRSLRRCSAKSRNAVASLVDKITASRIDVRPPRYTPNRPSPLAASLAARVPRIAAFLCTHTRGVARRPSPSTRPRPKCCRAVGGLPKVFAPPKWRRLAIRKMHTKKCFWKENYSRIESTAQDGRWCVLRSRTVRWWRPGNNAPAPVPRDSLALRKANPLHGWQSLRWRGLQLWGCGELLAEVVPDGEWPGMYRVHTGGGISDMANLTRAKDAAKALALRHLNEPATLH